MKIVNSTPSAESRPGRARRFPGTRRDWLDRRSKRFWVMAILLALLVLYTLAGFFLVPWIAERRLPEIATEQLQRPVTVDDISFNPFSLSSRIEGLRLEEHNGDGLAEIDSLYVNFQFTSLFRRAWTFDAIRLVRPSLHLVRLEDGGINLLQLLPEREPAQEEESDDPPPLVIDEIIIEAGAMVFTDQTRAGDYSVPVGPIDLSVANISTLPEDSGEHELVARSETGASIRWQGTSQLSPLLLRGEIEADGPYPVLLYEYFQERFGAVRITDGEARLRLSYRVQRNDDGELGARIEPLQFLLRDLTLTEPDGDTVFTLPEASLNGLRLRWPEQTVAVKSLSLDGAFLQLTRTADGQLNVQRWLATGNTAPAPAEAPAGDPDSKPLGGWTLTLDGARISDFDLSFEDASLREPGSVQLADLNLDLGQITSAPDARFPVTLRLSVASGGVIELEGDVGVWPAVAANAEYSVTGLALGMAQPWLSERVRARIDDGVLDLAGSVATSPDDPFNITGELALRQLAVSAADSEEPGPEEPNPEGLAPEEKLLRWQSLEVNRFGYSLADNRLELATLTLTAPFVRVVIDEDQNTNIGSLVIENPAASEDPAEDAAGTATAATQPTENGAGEAPPAQPFSMSLGQAGVEDGTVAFADLSLPLPFRTRIIDLNGGIESIDTDASEPAQVDLTGQVDEYGLATIKGTLTPLQPTEQMDLEVVFRNIDLPDLSSYTIKFAGRRIADGRMDLDLGYKLDDGKLQGSNDIVIHDLQLGDRVAYEGAADLPLGLAVALLKDSQGRIKIDLPVQGDVNNPSFDFGQVIGDAIRTLVARAATAPFRLLGSLVGGGGDEFDRLQFAPGSADLTPPERQNVAQLAEALQQRPALGLRVTPVVNPEQDRKALREQATEASIEAALADADTDQPIAGRRREAMEDLFRQRFPGGALKELRNAIQKPEDPANPEGRQLLDEPRYLAELRARLDEAQAISDEQLQELARERAETVIALLTDEGGVDPQRVQTGAVKAVEANDEERIPLKLEVESLE